MKKLILTLAAAISLEVAAQDFTNPVLPYDYSDPDVCRVGNDYYLTASSFNCSPGLPLLHSTDLVNWTIVGYALEKVPNANYVNGKVAHGNAVWAPSIRFHQGKYYIYWGDPDYGIYMVSATDPRGEWSEPKMVKSGRGFIDPCPFWDKDGKGYLVHGVAASRAKINSALFVQRLNAESDSVAGMPVLAYDGTYDVSNPAFTKNVNHTIEGPKMYARNGYYYILAPAGGVATGWQLALRSKNVYGPYESKIVMMQGVSDINGPHQGGWVDTPSGEDWFLHFQELQPFGRVVHLNPVRWVDDWPVMGEDKDGDGCGWPMRLCQKPNLPACQNAMQLSDDFNSVDLGLQWQWQANYEPWFGNTTNQGFIRIYSHMMEGNEQNMFHIPNMLLQKIPSGGCTVKAKVRVVAKDELSRAGLIVMGLDYSALMLQVQNGKFMLFNTTCKNALNGQPEDTDILQSFAPDKEYNTGSTNSTEISLYLQVRIDKEGKCRFGYSKDGKKYRELNGTFQAREGRWIGAKMGLVAMTTSTKSRSWIDCDWFEVNTDYEAEVEDDSYNFMKKKKKNKE